MSYGKVTKHFGGKMFNNVYKGKRVLVTGHTGFKGSWLSAWLLKLGAEVYGISKDLISEPSHFEVINLEEKINHTFLDIRNRNELVSKIQEIQPDIIFHLAANAIVRECYDNPADAFETNLMGSVNVLEAIRVTPSVQAAIMITSDKCYENVEWEYGYRETDQLGGKDPYSASKACAEIAFSAYFRSFLEDTSVKVATARAGNVIGGADWADHRIVPDCMRAWSKGEEVEIRSPNSTRPWQLVLEPLSGYLQLAQLLLENADNSINGESFNFGPAAEVNQPVAKLIEEMQKTWSTAKFNLHGKVGSKKECELLKLSCDKALFHLDWTPTLKFEETINMVVSWYQDFYQSEKKMSDVTNSQIDEYEKLAKSRGVSWAS